jgi:quercetin dioxygenase-like cupin family protein
MPAAGDVYSLREGESITVRSLAPELLDMEAVWVPADGKPPKHHHPSQDEHFEVLEGELTIEAGGGGPVVLRAGDTFDIPAKTVHRMWNSGEGQARATWEVRPSQRTAEMFETMSGGINPAQGAKVLWAFRREFRLATSLKG